LTKLYGEEGMSYALTYDLLASTPLTWTVAVAVCMKYGRSKSFKLKDSIITILKIPPIWGLIFGIVLRKLDINLPESIINVFKEFSDYVISVMLIIVGLSLKAVQPERFLLLMPAVTIKMVLSPLLGLFFATFTGLTGIPFNVCIIQAGMPSMLMSMIFATVFETDSRTTIEMIFFTTIVFFIIFSVFR